MMKKILFLTIFFLTIVKAVDINFKIDGTKYLQKINNKWVEFGKFAGVNFGISKPGYEPGQVILEYNDYIQRFQQMEIMGIKVVRVYSLLSPGFYNALNDWNKNHNPIYVLHGTGFPEYEMEQNNGTSVFDGEITYLMKLFIEKSLVGVYGGGKFQYKYDYSNGGAKPIYGEYTTDISQYLIGWVISGEISPYCINRTNGDINAPSKYEGKYFSSNEKASKFEVWVSEIFDYLAEKSIEYGHMAPISHTNWVTIDGISGNRNSNYFFSELHSIESRYNEIDFDSVEDWQEFDLHNIDVNIETWEAGKFYNQHVYPYYPDYIKSKISSNDPYKKYLEIIKNYYSDLPLIITEVGLPTSIGISSLEITFGRNHGFNTEEQQGKLMYDMMKMITDKPDNDGVDINGVIVFQMYDEWFKKSWNTKILEINRQQWKNALTSEQYYGIFNVESHPDLIIGKSIKENKYYKTKITNNYEFINFDINLKKQINDGEIIIGIDMMPGGVNYVERSEFKNKIDAYLIISKDKVEFKISSDYDAFKRQYGNWLDNKNINDLFFETTTFDDYKMLVKVPTKENWNDNNCNNTNGLIEQNKYISGNQNCKVINDYTLYDAHIYTLPFLETNDNLALVNRSKSNINIKIPYQILGFSDPSKHNKTFMTGFGKEFKVSHREYKNDINIEMYYRIGNEFIDSRMNMKFNWKKWNIPEYWMIKPKKSINAFRNAFYEINYNTKPQNLTQEQIKSMTFFNKIPNNNIFSNLHFYLVKISIIILISIFMLSSIGKIIGRYVAYCYSAQNIKVYSYHMIFYNFIVGSALIFYLVMDIKITFVVSNYIYCLYILIIIWDSILLLALVIFNKWELYKVNNKNFDTKEHAFIIACHNSSDVLSSTLQSLLNKVPGNQIYVADNGSTNEEQEKCKQICIDLDINIHYGHIAFDTIVNRKMVKRGNKTMAQYAAVCAVDKDVKFVTCIDDDTRLHETWDVNKVIKYFREDDDVVVLAYPLTADEPKYDIEWFQAMEYLISGFFKIFHSKVYSTIFNSGAFGTYRVDILKEAFVRHNTDYHGDDLQICMLIHQLKGKKFYHQPEKIHTQNYKVKTASDMIGTTIVPKCWFHLSSISNCFPDDCECGNPDLLQQRSKGWFVSKHRFIPKYIKMILNMNGINGIWVRFVALYELLIILNEYFAIFYIIFFFTFVGWWLLEGFIIAYAFIICVMTLFNLVVLQKNKQYIPYEFITIQPLIYKLFMVTIYRYIGLFYNLFIYSFKHKSGQTIKKRLERENFKRSINEMFNENNSNIV